MSGSLRTHHSKRERASRLGGPLWSSRCLWLSSQPALWRPDNYERQYEKEDPKNEKPAGHIGQAGGDHGGTGSTGSAAAGVMELASRGQFQGRDVLQEGSP